MARADRNMFSSHDGSHDGEASSMGHGPDPGRPRTAEVRDLLVDDDRIQELRREGLELPSWDLGFRQVCDLELLLNGGFSPLTGYLVREDHRSVCGGLRLADGRLWPIPISLDVTREFAERFALAPGDRIALRHPEGVLLAVLTVRSVWEPDRESEAEAVFGTRDEAHPG